MKCDVGATRNTAVHPITCQLQSVTALVDGRTSCIMHMHDHAAQQSDVLISYYLEVFIQNNVCQKMKNEETENALRNSTCTSA